MARRLKSAVFIIGASGIIAQVVLMRELLVGFCGNELTLGIILANWMISEALGVFIIGRLIERIRDKVSIFVLLVIVFSLILPVSIYFVRTFKSILGVPFAEALGLYAIFFVSLAAIFPVAFCHGALFSSSAKLFSQKNASPALSIGKIYLWETIGTIAGGIIFTFLIVRFLTSFQTVFLVSLFNLLVVLFFVRSIASRRVKSLVIAGFVIYIAILVAVGSGRLQRLSREQQWRGQGLIDNRNSPYGNIALTAKAGQKTFFYNGAPIITTPYPDTAFVEEFGNLPLLFHPAPGQVLVVGAGAGGLINEILKYPVSNIDYAELDPLIIKMLKLYPSELTERELSDKRVNLINADGRLFLHKTKNRYDLILIGLSEPSDLSTNRLFTEEFFGLAKSRLNKDGIISLWLPGSLTYISKELRDLNACILNGLKAGFSNTRVIPGDYNIILASDWQGLVGVTAAELSGKLAKLGIKTSLLNPAYLEYRLGEGWVKWFNQSQAQATKEINRDLQPFAVFQMLIFWNKQFSFRLAGALEALQGLNLKLILSLIAVISALILPISRRRPKFSIAYCIVTTGFFGMLVNLLLIFSFQVFYGYLYYMLGLLIAVFMAGIASGSALITRSIDRLQVPGKLLISLEIIIALFTLALGWVLTRFSGWVSSYWVFIPLFFLPGFLLGLEFPLASRIYLGNKGKVGATFGLLYAADLLGGWVAGILGGIVFLPILGLFNTCLVIVIFKFSSILFLRTSNSTYAVE